MIGESTMLNSVITGFTQFLADSVDYTVCSLDRKGMVILFFSMEKKNYAGPKNKTTCKICKK